MEPEVIETDIVRWFDAVSCDVCGTAIPTRREHLALIRDPCIWHIHIRCATTLAGLIVIAVLERR